MTHKRKRSFAFALVVCLLFGLLPGASQAEQTQTPPVADAPQAETALDAVPAAQTPTELTEAETVSLSKDAVRVIKGGTTTLTAEIPGSRFNRNGIYGEQRNTSFVTDNLIVCTGCRKAATGQIVLSEYF